MGREEWAIHKSKKVQTIKHMILHFINKQIDLYLNQSNKIPILA